MKTHTPNHKPATAPRALKVEPFTVTTEWVSVTTSILARHEERMQSVPNYQANRIRYCGDLVESYLCHNLCNDNRGLESACLMQSCLKNEGRICRITFAIEARTWARILNLCERINTTPTAFIRAAIQHAAKAWAKHDLNIRTA